MDRVSDRAIKSMCEIFFNCISRFEVDKNRRLNDPTLLVQRVFEEIVAREVDDFLNEISQLYLDAYEGFPGSKDSLLNIKRAFFQVLSSMKFLDQEDYPNKILHFIRETQPEFMIQFFEEIIHEAKILREKDQYIFTKEFSEKMRKIDEEILNLYEDSYGSPSHHPALECPLCENETTSYGCAWNVNKHIHFYCGHCGLNMMQ